MADGSDAARSPAKDAATSNSPDEAAAPPNAELLLPYLIPYGAYVGVAMLAGGLGHVPDYLLRIIVTGALLLALRHRFQPVRGPKRLWGSIATGAGAGLLGVLLWIGLLLPFQAADQGSAFTTPEFLLRLAAATLLVPFVEELLFRGYLAGLVTQWQEARRAGEPQPLSTALDQRSVHRIRPGAWTAAAVIVSSAAFAAGHSPSQWLAAFCYGILMAALWITRRDLVAPITAHAVTNFVLYIYVFSTESWGLW